MGRRYLLGTSALFAAGAIFAAPALGQATADTKADSAATSVSSSGPDAEIIVTARKREERLLDVPISIQAISSETLRSTGTYDLQDLKALSGFTFIKSLGTAAAGRAFGNLTFRGLQGEGGQQFEASGALFVDGIYASGGQSSVNTVDVDRVEILKGPQNAFFGRSTFGGAINLITKNPSNTFQGSVNASITSRGSSDVDATFEGPIAPDLLTARITVVNHDKNAEYRASDGGELGAERTRSITGTLYLTPTDGLWLRFRGHYQKDEDSAAAIGYLQGKNSTSCAGKTFDNALDIFGNPVTYKPAQSYYCGAGSIPSLAAVGLGVIDANTDVPAVFYSPLVSNSLGDPFLSKAPRLDHAGFAREVIRLSGQMGVDLPYDANLAVNIGYNSSNQVNFWDLDRSAQKFYYNVQPVLTHDFTADARITTDASEPIRALLGVSYFSSTYQLSQIDYQPALAAFGAAFVGPVLNTGNYNDLHSRVPAVYGSIDWDIAKQLTLSLEGRYQSDETTAFSRAGVPFVNKTKKFLPRASLSFKPDRSTNIYATYSEGIQPLTLNTGYINAGVVNPPNPALQAAARAYVSSLIGGATEFSPVSTLKNFEIGVKQQLFDGALSYSFAAYYEKWKNRITGAPIFNPATCMTANTIACPLPSSGTFVTFGNDVNIKGFEFSATAKPTKQLSLTLYVDYKDTNFPHYYSPGTRFTLTGNVTPGGNPAVTFLNRDVGKSPDLTGSFSATYRDHLSGDWDGYVRADVNYVGKQWESDLNFAQLNDYFRANLRFGIEKPNVTVEVFVKNLFNDKNWDNAYRLADLINTPTTFQGQGLGVSAPDKREIGLRTAFKF